ncbi:hypothetical protein J6590_063735 [Homalodisca vitripennis]|nr:hypothetical protein J6590_063735 [Homalodisca vitripennis]
MLIICNTPYECPKQRNATDCGAFVCAYAELFSAGDTPSGKTINPLKIRKDVARALRRRKMSQEDFRAYGEAGERRSTERRGIVLPDLTMEKAAGMTPRVNTPTDDQTSSWLSITASETWDMVEDENCSTPEIRESAPAAEPWTPTNPAATTTTC